MELKDKISYLRKKYGLTYEQIAVKVGVGKSTVRKWETGAIKSIRKDKLGLLAAALHTTEKFLTDTHREESAEDEPQSFGFYKVAAGVPVIRVANPGYNAEQIEKLIDTASAKGAQVLVTPELSLCGYTSADLFRQRRLLDSCKEALLRIVSYTAGTDILTLVGMPVETDGRLYNCAVAVLGGKLVGVVPKTFIPSEQKRWFASFAGEENREITLCAQKVPFGQLLFKLSDGLAAGVEIGEDLWAPVATGTLAALAGAGLILSMGAGAEMISRADYLKQLIKNRSAQSICAYVYAGAGVFESTTDTVSSGGTFIAENGTVISEGRRFERDNALLCGCIDAEKLNTLRRNNSVFADSAALTENGFEPINASVGQFDIRKFDRFVEPHPFIPSDPEKVRENCEEIFSIQTAALARRLCHTGMKKCVIGISGGLDSTLALLVSVRTLDMLGIDRKNVIGITMPGFGTTDRTYNNALSLMETLGVTVREISIKEACIRHFEDIGHDIAVHDVTYENAQARERTQILMDVANKEGALLVGTGDLSEIAMGWCTYNGDHMSMYGVNSGIPKTLMRFMVGYVAGISESCTADILHDILETPVSPELLPPDKDGHIAQKTEDNIGPYELHDFFLYYFFRFGFDKKKIAFLAREAFMGQYDDQTVDKWLTTFLRRFFVSQFKRSCSPDGPKVGTVSLSPRGDLKMPSDADFTEWMD